MYNGVILRERMRCEMSPLKIIIIVIGLFAVLLTFKADFVADRILHKGDSPNAALMVKYAALALAVIVCVLAFIVS